MWLCVQFCDRVILAFWNMLQNITFFWICRMVRLTPQKFDKTCLKIFGHDVWRIFLNHASISFLIQKPVHIFHVSLCYICSDTQHTLVEELNGFWQQIYSLWYSSLKPLGTFFMFQYMFNYNNISCSLSKSIHFLLLFGGWGTVAF